MMYVRVRTKSALADIDSKVNTNVFLFAIYYSKGAKLPAAA